MKREILVFAAASAILFFGSATTFASMGTALFAMASELHWSEAASGGAFLALGLVCAATSLSPIVLIPRIGGRWTMASGALILAGGFLIAAATRDLPTFYVAAGLFGLAFSLVANATGTYLIASWFGDRSPRMIGLYLMIGALGNAAGPPVAQSFIASDGGWRLYWMAMAVAAVLGAGLCAALIREPPTAGPGMTEQEGASAHTAWAFRAFLRTPQFCVAAFAMVATQTCIITVSAVTAPHFAQRGWSADFAAEILGLEGLIGTAMTGLSGWLTERRDPKGMLVAGLAAQAAGMVALAFAHSIWMAYAFALVFGIGWSTSSLAVTVLLIRYFGAAAGTAALSTIWLVAGVATGGPYVAGLSADAAGSFTPALAALGIALLPIAFAAIMTNPVRRVAPAG